MEIGDASANRRPLKSRSTAWAAAAARLAVRSGISANGVSTLGVLVSIVGAVALAQSFKSEWLFLIGAACIQLRLLCNLLDGMVAIEGGRASPTGAIFNEFPDRIEDSIFLAAAGYGVGYLDLGLLAALLAAACAYVRLLGATLGQPQDFGGPMAKPHRMAALTLGCIAAAATAALPYDAHKEQIIILQITLWVISAGTLLTIALRLWRMANKLQQR